MDSDSKFWCADNTYSYRAKSVIGAGKYPSGEAGFLFIGVDCERRLLGRISRPCDTGNLTSVTKGSSEERELIAFCKTTGVDAILLSPGSGSSVGGSSPGGSLGSVSDAKQKCLELGYKKNTDKLGECVLRLSR